MFYHKSPILECVFYFNIMIKNTFMPRKMISYKFNLSVNMTISHGNFDILKSKLDKTGIRKCDSKPTDGMADLSMGEG